MVVFGLTGDLMRQKGIPALFALYKKGALPKETRIVGFSRKSWDTSALRMLIQGSLKEGVSEEDLSAFTDLFTMVEGEGSEEHSYPALKEAVGVSKNLLVYLCINPALYAPIIRNLGASGLLNSRDAARILIEKPFGRDLESAQQLQKLLLQFVKEEQIFRIDHYLAKEAVATLRTINHETVSSLAVYLLETADVAKRGAVYDSLGALRDVGQNHMLEVAATIFGNNRTQTLSNLPELTQDMVVAQTRRAQYEGYRAIEGVSENSQVETWFRVETTITMPDGRHIPLLLEAGKGFKVARKEVVLSLTSGEKKTLSLETTTNEYEILLKDALSNERERFVSIGEVEALWHFIDPIEKAWGLTTPPLLSYALGSENTPA